MASPLLLVSATAAEAAPLREVLAPAPTASPWGEAWLAEGDGASVVLTHLGVGKANTAAGLALALERWQPAAVVQLGIGGAFVGSFLSIGMVAVAAVDVHVDCGAGEGDAWQGMRDLGFALLAGPPPRYNTMPTDAALSARLARASGLPPQRFATSERVTGSLAEAERLQRRFDVAIESMEGAAAAQVCLALGVPFAEVRGVSNTVGERDHRAWDVPAAVRAVNRVVEAALPELLVPA